MKKIMYIVAGLLVLAGLAFALSNTNLFKGTFKGGEFSFDFSGPDLEIPAVTTTPSTTATVSTPIDFIVDSDASIDSNDNTVDVSICLLEGQGDPTNADMVLEYTVYDTDGDTVDAGNYMLNQTTDIQKDPSYSASSTNDCLEYEEVFTLSEDTLSLSEFDVSFYVDLGDAITETNDENNGTNNNRTTFSSDGMGYVYAGEDALAFNMYWGDYEENYTIALDETVEIEFCYEGLTEEYTGETAKYYVYLDGTSINSQYTELTADECIPYGFTPDTNMTISEAGEYEVTLVIDEDEDFDESKDDNEATITFVVSDSAEDEEGEEISCTLTFVEPEGEISAADIELAYLEWHVDTSEGDYRNDYGVQAYDSEGNELTDRGTFYDAGHGEVGMGGIPDTEGFAETAMYYAGEPGDSVTVWPADYPTCAATVTSEGADEEQEDEDEEQDDEEGEEQEESPFEPDTAADDAYEQAREAGLSYDEAVEVGHRIQDEAEGRSEENIQALIESVIQEYTDKEVEELKDHASERLNQEDLEGDYITAILDQITEEHLDMTDEEFEEWLNEELEAARAEQELDRFKDEVRSELEDEGELTEEQIEEVLEQITSEEMESQDFETWLEETVDEVLRPDIDLAFGDVEYHTEGNYEFEVCIDSGDTYEGHPASYLLISYNAYDEDAQEWSLVDHTEHSDMNFYQDESRGEGYCEYYSSTFPTTIDEDAAHQLEFVIDYGEELEETDEENNTYTYTVSTEDIAEETAEEAESAYDQMVEFIREYLEEEGLTEEQIETVLEDVNEEMLDWDQETGMAWLAEQVEAATGTDEDDDTEDDQDADAETIAALEEALAAAIEAAEAATAAAEAAEAAASSSSSSGGDTYITYEYDYSGSSSSSDSSSDDSSSDDSDDDDDEDTSSSSDDSDEDEDTDDDFPFPDVDPDTWEGEAILTLYEMGIMKGDADGNARPWDFANRAEVLAMLMRSLYEEAVLELMSFEVTFADVPESAWYYNHVHAALKLGVIEEAEFFNPATPMTRAEFVHALVNAANELCTTCTADFSDVERSDWYYRALATALDAQIVSGFEDGTFEPNEYINRAGVAAIIVKALNADWVGR